MKDGTSMSMMVVFVEQAMKLKAKMVGKGQTSLKVKCGHCSGHLHASLVGPKGHMKLFCDGPCRRDMRE